MARRKKIKTKKVRNDDYGVGYVRYSSDRQGEATIEAQKRAITTFAAQNGITLMKWYEDRAHSGKDDNRPAFQQMKRDMEENDFGKILVHKVDRFSRSIIDFLNYEKHYQGMDVNVVYVAQPNMNEKIMKVLYITFAEMFLDNLSAEVTKGMVENAFKNMRNGGVAPYGYKLIAKLDEFGNKVLSKSKNPIHTVAIDPERAEAVKLMFNMIIEGFIRADIIKALDEKGYEQDNFIKVTDEYGKRRAVKSGTKSFTSTTIDSILRNKRYTGEYDFNYNKGTRDKPVMDTIPVKGEFPQIISKDTFEAVQKILATRKHRPPCNAEENYLLTGNIICGECGSQYSGMRCYRHGKKYVYYTCNDQKSHNHSGKREDYCRCNKVRQDLIEPFVIDELKKVVFNENFIDQVYTQYNNFAKAQAVDNSMVDVLKNKIAENESNTSNLLGAIEGGNYQQVLFDRLKRLEVEKVELQDRLNAEIGGEEFTPASKGDVAKIYRKARLTLDGDDVMEKRALINNFVNKIIVRKGKVEVYINLIPTTHAACLDLDILNTHLFSGELVGCHWDLRCDGFKGVMDLMDYVRLSNKPDAKYEYAPHFDFNYEEEHKNQEVRGESPLQPDIICYNDVDYGVGYSGTSFTTTNQQGLP